jgi:hypothetical protein
LLRKSLTTLTLSGHPRGAAISPRLEVGRLEIGSGNRLRPGHDHGHDAHGALDDQADRSEKNSGTLYW